MEDIIVTFVGEQCQVILRKYRNGRRAIELALVSTGEPMACATVNIVDAPLGADEVLIKDWSENAGVLAALVKARVVSDTGRRVPAGFAHAAVCRLLIPSN